MGSAEELLELKRRLMAGEIDADEYRRAKIAAYKAGAPRSRSDRLVSPSDSGRVERVGSGRLARPKRDSLEAKRRLLAQEEAQRLRAEDPAAAAIAAKQERLAAKDSRRVQAIQGGGGGNPAAAAIEAKRRKMAAAMARRREESPRGLQLVVIVRPRGMRTTARLAREEAERMRQEGLRLAGLEPEEPAKSAPPEDESAEDYIERRLREARERLRGE